MKKDLTNLREQAKQAEKSYHQFITEYAEGENPHAMGSAVSWARDAISIYKKLGDESYARKFGDEVINTLNRYEQELQEAEVSDTTFFKENELHLSGRIKIGHALIGQHTRDAIGRFQRDKKRIENLVGRDKERKDLARNVSATMGILGVLAGIFFLSTNITGNAIADLTTKTTSFIGVGLLIVGLVAGFFWMKHRK